VQISIFLPFILMAGTGGDGAQADSNSSTVASTEASTTFISPASIMPNSHFRSQAGFQNDVQNAGQSGARNNPQDNIQAKLRTDEVPQEIFKDCRPPVLDTRLSSRILFDRQLVALENKFGVTEETSQDQIFISRCGDQFVLFSRVAEGSADAQDALYLRFQEGTFQLVDQHWG